MESGTDSSHRAASPMSWLHALIDDYLPAATKHGGGHEPLSLVEDVVDTVHAPGKPQSTPVLQQLWVWVSAAQAALALATASQRTHHGMPVALAQAALFVGLAACSQLAGRPGAEDKRTQEGKPAPAVRLLALVLALDALLDLLFRPPQHGDAFEHAALAGRATLSTLGAALLSAAASPPPRWLAGSLAATLLPRLLLLLRQCGS
eukprot:4019457-Prymnesium_polylepis.1